MTSKTSKSIILRAFRIRNSSIVQSKSNLFDQLKNRLESSKIAKDRAMISNHNDADGERHLIAHYEFIENPNAIFCLVMQITQDGSHEAFSENLLEQNKIKLEDITKNIEEKNSISCLNSYYFLLHNEYIITNIPTNRTIKDLQIYLNWFTKDSFIELLPVLNTEKIKLSDIKSISIQDNSIKQYHQPSLLPNDHKSQTISLSESLWSKLTSLIQDMESLQKIDLSQIISAHLSIEFNKPKTMSETDYQNTLSAILKPIADIEDCTFKYKHDRIAKSGHDIIKIQKIQIQKTSNGNLNEKDLMQAMNRFAVSIIQDENIH